MSCGSCGSRTAKVVSAAIQAPAGSGAAMAEQQHCPCCGQFVTRDGVCVRCRGIERVDECFNHALRQAIESGDLTGLHCTFANMLKTSDFPDEVELRSPIVGRPRVVAIKRLPEPLRDAWNQKTSVDEVRIATCDFVGFAEDELQMWESPITLDEARKRRYGFFILTDEEHERAIHLLETYLYLDVNDFRGPLIGALYPLAARTDSPDPAWNQIALKLQHEQKARRAERAAQLKAQLEAEAIQAGQEVVRALSDLGWACSEPELVDSERVRIIANGYLIEYNIREGDRVKRAILNWKGRYSGMLKQLEFVEQSIKSGQSPIFEAGAFKVYYHVRDRNHLTVHLPTNLYPHFIGKGGSGIHGMEMAIGAEIHLREAPSVALGKRDGIYRLSVDFVGPVPPGAIVPDEVLLQLAEKLPTGARDPRAREKLEAELREFAKALASRQYGPALTELADVVYYAVKSVHNGLMTAAEADKVIGDAAREIHTDGDRARRIAVAKYTMRLENNRLGITKSRVGTMREEAMALAQP